MGQMDGFSAMHEKPSNMHNKEQRLKKYKKTKYSHETLDKQNQVLRSITDSYKKLIILTARNTVNNSVSADITQLKNAIHNNSRLQS